VLYPDRTAVARIRWSTIPSKNELNSLWDGVFHAATWILTVAGVFVLHHVGQRGAQGARRVTHPRGTPCGGADSDGRGASGSARAEPRVRVPAKRISSAAVRQLARGERPPEGGAAQGPQAGGAPVPMAIT